MMQQLEADHSAGLDDRAIAGAITERMGRIEVLAQIDGALSRAASQHNLAADIVRHGWPRITPGSVPPRAD